MSVSVSVVTVIRTEQAFDDDRDAEAWLDRLDDSDFTGELLDDALATLDRVRAANASSSGIPFGTPTEPASVLTARIGYGEGDQVASGRYLEALDVDARGGTGESRRERLTRTGSSGRTAAILGGREKSAACEVLIPRIRLDLDTGNESAARLSIAAAVGATIAELEFALEDEGHEKDLDRLESMLADLGEISGRAEQGDSGPGDLERVEAALEVAERVIRRRRILEQ